MILKGEIEAQLFSPIKALFKVVNGLYIFYCNVSCTLSIDRNKFLNLNLLIISKAFYTNGTHLFLAHHGMQGFKSPRLHFKLNKNYFKIIFEYL
mgnify:CR=1 FL=1